MSTVAEIIDAVKQLPPEQKRELFTQLETVILDAASARGAGGGADYLSPEFTRRLVGHFHRAKRAALGPS